jgi:hypothetical protein
MSCERFFIISTLSKTIETFRLHFLKIFLQTKIFFLTHFLYAKSTLNSDRELYKEKWCDQMRTWSFSFHWNLIHYWAFIDHCREARWSLSQNDSNSFHRLVSRDTLIEICREALYSISSAARNWTNLSFDQWFNEIVDYHLIDEHVEQINRFFDHFLFDEVNLNINVLDSRVKLEFLTKTMTLWLSSYIIIVWKYSTSHVNWVIRFRSQIFFWRLKSVLCIRFRKWTMSSSIVVSRIN